MIIINYVYIQSSVCRLFLDFSKNLKSKKLKDEKNSREFSEKLKPFLEKLKILPTQLDNI